MKKNSFFLVVFFLLICAGSLFAQPWSDWKKVVETDGVTLYYRIQMGDKSTLVQLKADNSNDYKAHVDVGGRVYHLSDGTTPSTWGKGFDVGAQGSYEDTADEVSGTITQVDIPAGITVFQK